jgi:ABC-type phosphate/phosphonate transport system substrate-binding protein
LGELDKQMSRALGKPVNFDLQLYKSRSWEALIGARQKADLQGMTFLTYVRMKEASPGIQPVAVERHRSEGTIYARSHLGLSNLTQISGRRMAFAHTNSVISFLAKVAVAGSGLCAANLGHHTNLAAPRFPIHPTATQLAQGETEGLGNEGFAHKEVLARVLNGEFDVGVAPYRRFHIQKGLKLVELHRFQITPDVYVARAGLSEDVVRALRASLLAIRDKTLLSSTKPGMRDGFEAVKDGDFDNFRKLLKNEWTFFETCSTNNAPGKTLPQN